MGFFGSKKNKSGESSSAKSVSGGSGTPVEPGVFTVDLRKARRFYKFAQDVAASRNYDYAIECYISGLRFDPDAVERYEALKDVAVKRKAAGGKGAGFSMKSVGSSSVDKMLTDVKRWALDPTVSRYLVKAMKATVKCADEQDKYLETTEDENATEIQFEELAYWQGATALEVLQGKPDKPQLVELVELFERVGAYKEAVEAGQLAVRMDKSDSELQQRLKNLEAELYSRQHTTTEKGDFRQHLKDADRQADIQSEIRTDGAGLDELIKEKRIEWNNDRENTDLLMALAQLVERKDDEESRREAVALFMKLYELTDAYKHRVHAGDLQMTIFESQLKLLRKARDEGNEKAAAAYKTLRVKQVKFELSEYADRVKHYPTDLKMRHELGKRQYKGQMFDDAISSFQQAKSDAKCRLEAGLFLGRCYVQKKWHDEAVETFQAALGQVADTSSMIAKEIQYELMLSLARLAKEYSDLERAEQAQKIASRLLQEDINFKDIRAKLESIRSLTKRLRAG